MTNPSKSFWDYSTALYSQDGVESACLFLQDHMGMDVNLLLFCCWYGQHYGSLEANMLDSLLQFTGPWKSNVVEPQRNARRWMKEQPLPASEQQELFTTLRERIKLNELAAEKFQQLTMQHLVETRQGRPVSTSNQSLQQVMRENVELVLESCSLESDAKCEEKLNLVIEGAVS